MRDEREISRSGSGKSAQTVLALSVDIESTRSTLLRVGGINAQGSSPSCRRHKVTIEHQVAVGFSAGKGNDLVQGQLPCHFNYLPSLLSCRDSKNATRFPARPVAEMEGI